jgi:LTXXQ motif family protein
MRKYVSTIILLLLPTVVLAQGEGRRTRRGMEGMQANVIQVIIDHKADLSLTANQIAKLEPIARKLEEQNKPVIAEMQKVRGNTNVRELSQEQRDQMRPQMQKLRDHRQAALTEAKTVLTQEQQTKLRDFVRVRTPRRR